MSQQAAVLESISSLPSSSITALTAYAVGLDHVALAVPDLEKAITFYRDVLGFTIKERRATSGKKTAMVSAVITAGPLTFVLVQGTSEQSQVSRYVDKYGAGVQHIAIEVNNLPELTERLKETGMEFDTTIIQGEGIRQIFTKRDPASGMMYELIERQSPKGHFTDESVQQLFEQLEASDAF